MTSFKDRQIRALIAEQAAEWFVENDASTLDAAQSAALVDWLRTSPLHVEEFLRVAGIARDLDSAGAGLGSLEDLIARAQAADDRPVQGYWSRTRAAVQNLTLQWQTALVTTAVIGVVSLGVLWFSKLGPLADRWAPSAITPVHFATHHGEQQTQRLPDNSVLHINTDTAIAVRYSNTERLVVLESGEADFEVAHESDRAFRVVAGPAQAIAHGTQFDVRLKGEAAVVTVIEGRVGVAPSGISQGTGLDHEQLPGLVELQANQEISISNDDWAVAPTTVDAQRATAWLHHQIAFDHEPLAHVAAEYNRYAKKPIEIATPELGKLEISGTFSTDESEEFLAFLRSLEGVRIDVTATRILVSQR